jgi:hypothetical protein
MKMELTECSEMLTHKVQMLGYHSEERIQYAEHGERLKSRGICFADIKVYCLLTYLMFR